MTLAAGDCIYIPSYWWYQLEVPTEPREANTSQSSVPENSLIVTYWYNSTSSWLDLVMHGVSNNIL
jgi:Cupin-like domain